MPKPSMPGSVFENLFPIRRDFKANRVVFNENKALSFDLFVLSFSWLSKACKVVKLKRRSVSFNEFEEITEDGDAYQVNRKMLVEVISDGRYCILLVNTCPVAQIDIKGDVGLAEFFDVPAMNEEEWSYWEMLGASTVHFELFCSENIVKLVQVKKEEGIVNALRMRRVIDMRTGDSEMHVSCPKCSLSHHPSFQNLLHWVDVRAGTCNPVVLDHF